MRPNGFIIVMDLAIRKINAPLLNAYRKALILGALRENVYYIPGIQIVSLNPSISHFYHRNMPGGIVPFVWPGPRFMGNYHFRRAICDARVGRTAAAFVQLGRVSHLLTDMACPVHAKSVFHSTDPYEWCVEGMMNRFDVSQVKELDHPDNAGALIESMAEYTQQYPAETVNNPWGFVLRYLGMRKTLRTDLVREQAAKLIPVAASHTVRLFRLFLKNVAGPPMFPADPLTEILPALQMHPSGLRKWFRQIRRFCMRHGGTNHYTEILGLLNECERELQNFKRVS